MIRGLFSFRGGVNFSHAFPAENPWEFDFYCGYDKLNSELTGKKKLRYHAVAP